MLNHDFSLNNKGVSNSIESSGLPRYRWYFYKEGFSPSLVQHAIDYSGFDKKKDIILDPFNGGGTVTLFSALNGYNSVGYEVNPFSSFISRTKQVSLSKNSYSDFQNNKDKLLRRVRQGNKSSLLKFSTFSEFSGKDQWLFNSQVLNAFEGGNRYLKNISNSGMRQVFKLALLNSAMENCNAKKDGKCLRYKGNWQQSSFDETSYEASLETLLSEYFDDLSNTKIEKRSTLLNGDSRKILTDYSLKYKLCITSPPYLNSFDYTDVYRPELFLGEFISSPEKLLSLRKKTIRSHASVSNSEIKKNKFGLLYESTLNEIAMNKGTSWQKKVPLIVQGYFEDMALILKRLKMQAAKDAQLWLVVSNSAYNDIEIPVDLILADIATKTGWKLLEIGVLRNILKRGSKYSPNITYLRESVVILSK